MTAAPLPKSDPAARLVLGYLAVKADKDGRNSYPLVLSVAHALDLNPEVIPRVFKRLCGYGLISKDGVGPQGQTRWVLNMELRRPADSFESFAAKYRESAAARKARYRKGSAVHDAESGTVHDRESETVHDSESETTPDVHDFESSCPGSTVVLSTTLDPDVHDSEYPHISPLRPDISPDISPTADAASAAGSALFDAPNTEPAGRKRTAKRKLADPRDVQAQELATRYYEAMSKMVPFMGVRQVVKQALGPFTYEQVRDALDRMSSVDRGRPLTRQTLLAAIEAPNGRASSGHRPYSDPADQSVYDEPLMGRTS